jgi:hypothetical protein
MKRSRGAILAAATHRLGLTTGNGGMAAGLRLPAPGTSIFKLPL